MFQKYPRFWPESRGEMANFGPISVELVEEYSTANIGSKVCRIRKVNSNIQLYIYIKNIIVQLNGGKQFTCLSLMCLASDSAAKRFQLELRIRPRQTSADVLLAVVGKQEPNSSPSFRSGRAAQHASRMAGGAWTGKGAHLGHLKASSSLDFASFCCVVICC